ncbi:hypothetical protein LINPERHAP1_LOCUS14815, partial [Linum perenne]
GKSALKAKEKEELAARPLLNDLAKFQIDVALLSSKLTIVEMENKEIWEVNERMRHEEAQMVNYISDLDGRIKELRSLALQLKQVATTTYSVSRKDEGDDSFTIEQLLLNHQIAGQSDNPPQQHQQQKVT